MRVLVTYYSESGNTEKLAQAIYENLKNARKEILPIHQATSLEGYDLIFAGFPVHGSSAPDKASGFLKRIPKDKMLALFATHGSLRGGQLAITAFYHAMGLAHAARLLGTFGCRGEVSPKVIEALMTTSEHRGWALEAQSAIGHPDSADLEDGRQFAQWMMTKARAL